MISDIYGCSIIILVSSIICLILTTLLTIIHIRQPLLRVGFFNVIFGTIIIELLMHVFLIINSIITMILNKNQIINIILGFFNDFFFSTHISYNLIMISSFINQAKTKDPLINKDLEFENSRETLNLQKQSFLYIHITSIFLGAIHASASISTLSIDTFIIPFSYLSMIKIQYYVFPFFIYHLVYLVISLWYLSISWNKFKISNHIRLKNYSWYCFTTSLLWQIIPICFIVEAFYQELNYITLEYVSTSIFALLMLSNTFFHYKCYYVSYLIKTKSFSVFSTICFAIKLLLCIENVPELNFIDFTSAYIFHSLCTENDLLSVDQENDSFHQEQE